MLKTLSIEQFVIIDKLELEFKDGLTILTGETGAGKSILLGAMGLILGEPARFEAIRTGSDQSTIRATLEPPEDHRIWDFLLEHKLCKKSTRSISIDRIIRKDETEEILVNGSEVERDFLRELGTYMIEIHGQFANQSLMDPDNQLRILDLSGDFPPEVFKNVATALAEVHRYKKELEDEKLFLAQHKDKAKRIEQIVRTFDELGMEEGFVPEVLEDYNELLTAKESSEAFQAILSQFIAGNGIVGSLSFANHTINRQANLDEEKVANLKKYLADALENARYAVQEIRNLSPEYEIDTSALAELEHVLGVLHGLSDESGVPLEKLHRLHVELTTKLHRIRNGRERLAELEKLLHDARQAYRHHAHVLTEHRTKAAVRLSTEVTREMAPLKLANAQFEVRVKEDTELPWTNLGLNTVTFMARMNPGTPFTSIAETASGGEMARMMLALKVVVQEVQMTPTLVFDEVDTGIGGAAASAVGERLAELSGQAQVFVITHSPQVASRGQQHLHVSKQTDGKTTTSVVKALSPEDRVEEISRMLSGHEPTEEAYAAAKRLLAEARTSAEQRKKAEKADRNAAPFQQ